jgi:hypothetical protein
LVRVSEVSDLGRPGGVDVAREGAGGESVVVADPSSAGAAAVPADGATHLSPADPASVDPAPADPAPADPALGLDDDFLDDDDFDDDDSYAPQRWTGDPTVVVGRILRRAAAAMHRQPDLDPFEVLERAHLEMRAILGDGEV